MELTSNSSSSFPINRPQSAAAQSINSVNSSRVSVLSRQTQNSQSNAFDQDDCGTIKRQPVNETLNNSLSTSTFNSNLYGQRSSHSPVLTSTSNSSSIHSSSSRNATTINAEIHNGEPDSDEEHFPPPPEMTAYIQQNQSIYQNGLDLQRPPTTPSSQNVQFRNGVQVTIFHSIIVNFFVVFRQQNHPQF